MNFKNYKDEGKKYGVGGVSFQLKEGENKIRILSHPEEIGNHFMGAGQMPAICTDIQTGKKCPYCKTSKRIMKIKMYILDRADEQIKIATFSWSIYAQIGQLAESSEWGFESLPSYDLIITRTGTGKETRYGVIPTPNQKPITVDQQAKLAKLKPIEELIQGFIIKQSSNESPAPSAENMPPETDESMPDFLQPN